MQGFQSKPAPNTSQQLLQAFPRKHLMGTTYTPVCTSKHVQILKKCFQACTLHPMQDGVMHSSTLSHNATTILKE